MCQRRARRRHRGTGEDSQSFGSCARETALVGLRYCADGVAPREITRRLNAEGIPPSTGATWSASTILGHRQRRTGILCNEIYIGRLVWNVCAYSRDPATGKRHERFNPEAEWQVAEVPDLRLVDQETWLRLSDTRSHAWPTRARATPKAPALRPRPMWRLRWPHDRCRQGTHGLRHLPQPGRL